MINVENTSTSLKKIIVQLISGPCKFLLPTFSHVSTHLIFFFIGNTNKGLVSIPSRRLNVDKLSSITQNHSIQGWIPLSGRHLENALVVSPQYGPRGIRCGGPSRGRGRGSYLTSPQAYSFRLKDIKSILAKSN